MSDKPKYPAGISDVILAVLLSVAFTVFIVYVLSDEIHRMQVQTESLQRKQETLIWRVDSMWDAVLEHECNAREPNNE